MKPIYKSARRIVGFCPKCKEALEGSGSIISSYRCKCGRWEAVIYPFEGEYEIIKEKENI